MADRLIRLVNREWQGGQIPDYHLGAMITELLAPASEATTVVVPVRAPESATSADVEKRAGIDGLEAVRQHLVTARELIDREEPARIAVIAGDCSGEIAPFSYLRSRYGDGFGVIWIDAHPDLWDATNHSHFNAMAVSALIGDCSPSIDDAVAPHIPIEDFHWVGLRAELDDRIRSLDIALAQRTTSAAANESSASVLDWIRSRGLQHVAVHIDLDSLDPGEFDLTAVPEPGGLTFAAIARLCKDISTTATIVGLGVAEHAPAPLRRLRDFLGGLPLIGE